MPDGRTLAIANGGIETHPDFGRAELNLDTMEPSLAFVDAPTGDLIGLLKLDAGLHQLSIRHMAVDARNRVWFGCQFRGELTQMPQLVGYATLDGDIRLIELPPDTLGSLRNYVGSVAASADGTLIAVSSPEGDSMLAIDAAALRPAATLVLRDGCGLARRWSGVPCLERGGRAHRLCRLVRAGPAAQHKVRQSPAAFPRLNGRDGLPFSASGCRKPPADPKRFGCAWGGRPEQ